MADPTVLLVHKVPAFWESEAKAKTGIGHDAEFDFSEIKNPTDEEKFFLDELESDIFFLIADSIAKHLSLPRVDVLLGHDPREIRNWDVISKDGYLDRKGNFVFWSTLALWMFFPYLKIARNTLLFILILSFVSILVKIKNESDFKLGVILSEKVEVKSGRSLDTITLFQLHEGALVNIVGKHDDWLEVRLNDKQKGWVPQSSLGI